jgi:hypothetical protein
MRRTNLWRTLSCGMLLTSALVAGCNRNENNGRATGEFGTDSEIDGGGRITTGAGGEGSGPTGTGGQEPADNEEAAVGNADVGKQDEE